MDTQKDNSLSFKVFFSQDNVRRFRMVSRPTFEDFVHQMQQLYAPNYHPELRIQYVDGDEDKIDVTSELEWNEMFKELGSPSTVKLYISETKDKKYFKDGPAPEILYFYNTPDKKPVNEQEKLNSLRSRVPKCLESLFVDKKILPHNMPSFLEGVVKVTNLPDNQVELDVDVELLRNHLDKTALAYLDKAEKSFIQKGRETLQALLILCPEDPRTLYNLACAHSLLGSVQEALESLSFAVQFGWCNLDHMLADADLNNIRGTEKFQQMVQYLKSKISSTPASAPKPAPILTPASAPTPAPVTTPAPAPKPVPTPTPAAVLIPASVPTTALLPKIVPIPSPSPAYSTKYVNELRDLHDMGFLQDEKNLPLLEKYKGNVQQVVTALL